MAIEWLPSRYGESYSAKLAPGLRISVVREIGTRGGPPPKFRAKVFEAELKAQFDTEEDAKDAASRAAKKWLGEALFALSEPANQ